MSTIVEAPPEPSHDELEALIEEARRRARRRRLVIGGAIVGSLVIAGLVTGLVLVLRDSSDTAVPKGFHAVQARGPVQHALVETVVPAAGRTVDLATGSERPTRSSQEVWWDARSGFARTVYRQDGRVAGDVVEQQCQPTGKFRFCPPPSPFDLRQRGLGWPPKEHFARRVGTGTFRGHRVVWIEGLVQPGQGQRPYPSGSQVAYDAVTHRPLALRTIARSGQLKGLFSLDAVKQLPNLEAKQFSFVVPDGGASFNPPGVDTQVRAKGLAAARKALGRTPLWLGRSFRGNKLTAVVVGDEAGRYEAGRYEDGPRFNPAPFVRFDYGKFSVQEFGDKRTFGEQGPAEGTAFLGGRLTFNRDGLLITVQPSGPKFRPDRETALTLAKALRPVDG